MKKTMLVVIIIFLALILWSLNPDVFKDDEITTHVKFCQQHPNNMVCRTY